MEYYDLNIIVLAKNKSTVACYHFYVLKVVKTLLVTILVNIILFDNLYHFIQRKCKGNTKTRGCSEHQLKPSLNTSISQHGGQTVLYQTILFNYEYYIYDVRSSCKISRSNWFFKPRLPFTIYLQIILSNGTVYEIHEYINKILPEITDFFLSKHCCLALARQEVTKLHYTSLIINAMHEAFMQNNIRRSNNVRNTHVQHEGTIATKRQQNVKLPALRAPPGLDGVETRLEGEAQSNAGSDGLGVTVDN
ncbi:Hypothetical_protein [Hexamita inflata]|uniref:Hypothetical_protein n=1 Tax=Hexamita inflata TaxID=28002 RepID=A0AA86TX10_9EUKA|nr:Hypothetical protein HINF_LOCUS19679 [Hexamita inflata]